MTLGRVAVTGLALWLAAQVIAGVRLAAGLDPLARIGTVLVVALVLCAVQAASRWLRRVVIVTVGGQSLPVSLVVAAALNAAVFWAATSLASAAGLGYTVDGLLAALLGSLMLAVMVGLAGRFSAAR